jgi:hypothetical protein
MECLYIEMRFVPFECMCHKTQISIVQHFLLCFLPESKHRFSRIQKKNAACREEMFLMCLEACDIEPFNTRAGKQRSQCRVMFCALFFSASTLSSPHCQPFFVRISPSINSANLQGAKLLKSSTMNTCRLTQEKWKFKLH